MWMILTQLVPILIDPVLNYLNKKVDAATESQKTELQRQIAIIEAQKQLGLAREGHLLGRIPVFLVAFSTGLYYASVMLVSIVNVNEQGRWTPLELPADFKLWVGVVISGMFAVGAAQMFIKR